MKVLLTHSYFLHFDPKQKLQSKPYPPLATLIASSYVRQYGFEVAFFDVQFEEDSNSFLSVLDKEKPDVLVVYDDGFNYLTKMCLTNMRAAAMEMAHLAKKRGIHVLISSSDSTDHYQQYLNNNVDVVLLGEAEDTLIDVLQYYSTPGLFLDTIQGIAFKKDQKFEKTEKRVVRKDLDTLPFAAWDLLNIKPYQEAWKKHGYFSINMATTRGCPYKCNWCAKPIYGNRYNSRSPKHVVDELLYIRTLFHFDHVWFSDDIFGLKPGWVYDFLSELKNIPNSQKIDFKYKIQSRADLLLDGQTIQYLVESGADEVWIGAESGSQKILDAMDKGITVEQIYNSTQKMKMHGLKPCFFLQFGYLHETRQDIESTLKMLFELMPYDIGISVSYPLPGTKFYEKVKHQLSTKQNWTDSNELLLMYKSTFSPFYYKTLHKYVHRKYRAKQGFIAFKNILTNRSNHWKKAMSFFYHLPISWIEKGKLRTIEYL